VHTDIAKLGNLIFAHWPAAYQPLYSCYKALADREERRLLRSALYCGMTVVDVGANIGVYSAFLADLVGPGGIVYAFEPESRNFAFLEKAADRSSCIHPTKAAVGERSGTLKLYLSKELNVDHHTYDSGEGRLATDVPVVQLDEFFSPGRQIDFIKLDIQGFELQALRGARRILSENSDIKLLFEYWPYGLQRAGTDPAALLQFLEELGFELTVLNKYARSEIRKLGGGINNYTNIFASR
jgi:FkbM family methyltransferase